MINQGHQAPALQAPVWADPPMGATQYYAAAAAAPTGWNSLHSPLNKPNKLPTYSKRMWQLWGEVEDADVDMIEEAADVHSNCG